MRVEDSYRVLTEGKHLAANKASWHAGEEMKGRSNASTSALSGV